jgi:hypothetical protein
MKKATALYRRIREILESAKAGVARTVNSTQVVANWLIGREIVEEEQRGLKRAGYGEKLIHDLAERLTKVFGRGYSEDNLFWFRRFYGTYPEFLRATKFDAVRQISRSLGIIDAARQISGPSADIIFHAPGGDSDERGDRQAGSTWEPGLLHANFSWTHYRTLLRVESATSRYKLHLPSETELKAEIRRELKQLRNP